MHYKEHSPGAKFVENTFPCFQKQLSPLYLRQQTHLMFMLANALLVYIIYAVDDFLIGIIDVLPFPL